MATVGRSYDVHAIHCGRDTTVAEALRLMGEVDRLVVVEGGRAVGVITRSDLTPDGTGQVPAQRDTVGQVMRRDIAYLAPERSP